MFFAQLTNELWKLFGKKRTYIGFGAFVLVQSVMLIIFRFTKWQIHFQEMLGNNGYVASEYISALTVALIMVWPQVLLLMPLYVALVGGDLVAKEAEDGTLRMILCRPISRLRLLIVKWLGGAIFAAVLVLVLGVTALATARIFFPWGGMFISGQFEGSSVFNILPSAEGLQLYALSHLFMVINAITIMSVAFMFSSFNVKPAAATILAASYLFMSLVMQHIPFFEAYQNWFVTHHFEAWFLVFQNPAPWSQIFQSEITLAAVSTTAFIIGAMGFQIRDIKS
jgi:ABC-2 type transport system permease protein